MSPSSFLSVHFSIIIGILIVALAGGFLYIFRVYFFKILNKIILFLDKYLWNNLIVLLTLFVSLAIIFYISSYFISDVKLSSIMKDIGSVIIAGAVFQFILKSKGFMKVVDETLDHTKRQWKKYNFDYIKKLLETIKEAHSFFEFDFNKTKFESINAARDRYLQMTEEAKKIHELMKMNSF
ncbi:MAG: hypothetical protein PHO27_06135 [Sulfuricurvum sp.]|nr:hypothetical protein [Sulfuricurvum sp.]